MAGQALGQGRKKDSNYAKHSTTNYLNYKGVNADEKLIILTFPLGSLEILSSLIYITKLSITSSIILSLSQ